MNGITLSLLILGATVPMAALGLGAGLLVERLTGAPGLRERVWSLALLAPVLAIAAAVLISPHLSRPALPQKPAAEAGAPLTTGDITVIAPQPVDPLGKIAEVLLLLGPVLLLSVLLLGMLVGLGLLARRHVLLDRLLAGARPLNDDALRADLDRQAAALKVRSPALKASDRAGSPLLAGLIRPAIVIPKALTRLPTARLALICGHELAHLKRGDNPRAWAENVLLALLWFNPFMAMIHSRLNAAREEHCDAIALAQADTAARRAYAETLIETLRLSAGPEPQSAFIGAGRKTAMRLKAILTPHTPATLGARAGVIAIATALALSISGGAVALAMQAAPVKAVAGRASQWTQSVQNDAQAPEGVIQVAADQMIVKDGVAHWSGRPVIVLTPATGDPRRDAELAGVTFRINGKPAPADFTPNSLEAKDIGLIKVRQRTDDEGGPTVVDIIMAPEAPPAPPAPPAPVVAPTPLTPWTAPTPPTPPVAPMVRIHAPPPAPPAPPAQPAPPKPVISRPVWEARPTGADIAAVYPRDALSAGLSGRVILMCKTTEAGLLTECVARGETPAGNGFAEAALKLASKFRIRTTTADGLAVSAARVNIPIVFNAPPATPSPRPTPTTR